MLLEIEKQFRPSTSIVYPPFKKGKYMEEYFYDYFIKHKIEYIFQYFGQIFKIIQDFYNKNIIMNDY